MENALLTELLDEEVALCKEDELLCTNGVAVWRECSDVLVKFARGRDGKAGCFRLGCAHFDAQPPTVAMVDVEIGKELGLENWTPGVAHGVHPVTGRPFVCIQGI